MVIYHGGLVASWSIVSYEINMCIYKYMNTLEVKDHKHDISQDLLIVNPY